MTRVLIADDHPVVRRGLEEIVNSETGFQVTGRASNGSEVLELVRQQSFDVVVLDISMPKKNGLDTLKILKSEFPEIRVLVMSVYPEEQYAIRVLRAGAAGYLTKDSAPEQLINAINKAISGGRYLSSTFAEILVNKASGQTPSLPHETLSDREHQVLCQIASGASISQIAGNLSLSVKTVSTYKSRIMAKMNLSSTSEITQYALRNDLI